MAAAVTGSALFIEEVYKYTLSLEQTAQIKLCSTEGRVRFALPCSRKQIGYLLGQDDPQQIGALVMQSNEDPAAANPEECEIVLPSSETLQRLIETNKVLSWEYKYEPPPPTTDLFSASSEIVDSTEIDLEHNKSRRNNKGLFERDLRLSIKFNVPNLLEEKQKQHQQELDKYLNKVDSKRFGHLKRPTPTRLAREIAGMANAEGGDLLIRYNASLNAFQHLALKAVLSIAPLIPLTVTFFPRHLLQSFPKNGAVSKLSNYLLVTVPSAEKGTRYLIEDEYHKRDRDGRTSSKKKNRWQRRFVRPSRRINFDELLSEMQAKRPPHYAFVMKDNGLDYVRRLGKAITSFVNENVPNGTIVIRRVRTNWWQLRKELLEIIRDKISPQLKISSPQIRLLGRELIAIITVDGTQTPAALFEGIGYRRDGDKFAKVPFEDLYKAYQRYTNGRTNDYPQNEVQLGYLELSWPVDPFPEPVPPDNNGSYDVQRHALVWKDVEPEKPDNAQPEPFWKTIKIDSTLQHAAVDKDRDGKISADDDEIIHKGKALLTIKNVLASKSNISLKPDTSNEDLDHGWLSKIPVIRSTQLQIRLKMNLGEHWRYRRIQTLLNFPLRDTTTFDTFTAGWKQLCSDLGFTLLENYREESDHDHYYYFAGVRQKRFHDIWLVVDLFSQTQKVAREIRYERRKDRKRVDMSTIDVWVYMLGGTGEAIREICKLQNDLHQLATERFGYLSSDEA